MSIPWTAPLRFAVEQHLSHHPLESGECRQLAKALFPLAQEIDEKARALSLTPKIGRYLAAKVPQGRRWAYHITVEVHDHRVDAWTGADGVLATTYLDALFQYPTFITEKAIDIDKEPE